MAGKRHHRRSHKKSQSGCNSVMWGGDGTSDRAIAVYGGIGQQHAGVGNVIAQNPVQVGGSRVAALSPAPVQVGGSRVAALSPAPVQVGGSHAVALSPSPVQVGGTTGTELAVPAVLLIANQTFRRRRGSSKKRGGSSKKRRSNRRR